MEKADKGHTGLSIGRSFHTRQTRYSIMLGGGQRVSLSRGLNFSLLDEFFQCPINVSSFRRLVKCIPKGRNVPLSEKYIQGSVERREPVGHQ